MPDSVHMTPGDWLSVAGANKVVFGLGWEAPDSAVDLDASVLVFDKKGKLVQAVYHNNIEGKIKVESVPEEARESVPVDESGKATVIVHSGDERAGASEHEEDERIVFNLAAMPKKWARCVFVVSAYDGTFDKVDSCFVRMSDVSRGADAPHELMRMDLTLPEGDRDKFNGLIVAELYKDAASGDWVILGRANKTRQSGLQELADLVKEKIILQK